MPWMIPVNKLDDTQRSVIQSIKNINKPIYLQGPAGAGKSVALAHILKEYQQSNQQAKACMVLYTRSLIDMFQSGLSELADVAYFTSKSFKGRQWDFIGSDEFQDLSNDTLQRIVASGKKVVFAGDFGQSIYENGCPTDHLTENDHIIRFANIYRLTKGIQNIAALFADSPDIFRNYVVDKRVASTRVQTVKNADLESDQDFVWNKAQEFIESGYSTAVLLSTNDAILQFANRVLVKAGHAPWATVWNRYGKADYHSLNSYLQEKKLPLQVIGQGAGSMRQADADSLASVMTFHSAKGLDFEAVFIPNMNMDYKIWDRDATIERRLFFVALTRSRQDLFLTYYGQPHRFIEHIPKDYVNFQDRSQMTKHQSDNNNTEDDIFDF